MKIEVISRPYAASDGLVQSIVQNSRERWSFTVSEFLCEFPQISRDIITV
jgi:hypothetical protein